MADTEFQEQHDYFWQQIYQRQQASATHANFDWTLLFLQEVSEKEEVACTLPSC